MLRTSITRVCIGIVAAYLGSLPLSARAWPDAPMCVVERDAPMSWGIVQTPILSQPICEPGVAAPLAIEELKVRALDAFSAAQARIANQHWNEARLQLDLAEHGLPKLQDHVALVRASVEESRKNYTQALLDFEIAKKSPVGAVRVRAQAGILRTLILYDPLQAEVELEQVSQDQPHFPDLPRYEFNLAYRFEELGQLEKAARRYHRLQVYHPGSPQVAQAQARLEKLRTFEPTVHSPSLEEEVTRATLLLARGPISKARSAISTLLEKQNETTTDIQQNILHLAGDLARYESRWAEALRHYRNALALPHSGAERKRILELRVTQLSKLVDPLNPEQTRSQIKQMRRGKAWARIRGTKRIEMLKLAADSGLKDIVRSIVRSLGKGRVTQSQRFIAAMISANLINESDRIALLRKVSQGKHRSSRAAHYHLARAYENSGKDLLARALFHQLATEPTYNERKRYYQIWARNALKRLEDPNLVPQTDIPKTLPSWDRLENASSQNFAEQLSDLSTHHELTYPWLSRARDLFHLGMLDEAREELLESYLAWRRAHGRSNVRAGIESVAMNRNQKQASLDPGLRIGRVSLSTEERGVLSEIAGDLGAYGIAYGFGDRSLSKHLPYPHKDLVFSAAQRHRLDPDLLFAVMRVESVYQQKIVSYAGAVGLMQIMPRTGYLIAEHLERQDFTPADLLNPEINIEFAAWYLRSLLNRFDQQLPLAIAAYNGGPHNLRQWLKRYRNSGSLDVFLERIPFTQTHRYVRRVLVYYDRYRQQKGEPDQTLALKLPELAADPIGF